VIKAIIFDCFGVLTTQGLDAYYEEYLKHSPEKMTEAKNLIGQLNIGHLEHDEFIEKISILSGVAERSTRDYLENNKPNKPLLEYTRAELKGEYKIGMLSNAQSGWVQKLLPKEDLQLFDAIVLSGDIGVAKPNLKAYQTIANKLSVEPEECIFIDDLTHYCEAAKEAGMQAIWYQSFEQFRKDIEALLAAKTDN
jgi:putative hydrolase of the HAD superfamily